jgi:limonene-1,2-epoxide hydrolase
VRRPLVLALLAVAGCGGEPPSAESVVRAWSASVNDGDNAAAARMFARGATVVRNGEVRTLRSYNAAHGWNAALRWCGRIVSVRASGATVRAVFMVRTRRRLGCTGPGERAHTLFRVREGKIILWHELEQAPQPDEESA